MLLLLISHTYTHLTIILSVCKQTFTQPNHTTNPRRLAPPNKAQSTTHRPRSIKIPNSFQNFCVKINVQLLISIHSLVRSLLASSLYRHAQPIARDIPSDSTLKHVVRSSSLSKKSGSSKYFSLSGFTYTLLRLLAASSVRNSRKAADLATILHYTPSGFTSPALSLLSRKLKHQFLCHAPL